MENGQFSVNQQALEDLIQTRLNEAKATAVEKAITELNALANRKEAVEIENSETAATNAIDGLEKYAESIGIVAQNAIIATGNISAMNAAIGDAQSNPFVNQEEIDTILSNMNNTIELIDSLGSNLHTNFSSIVSKDSDSSSDTALEKLQKKYERKISELDNKKTYIENEIEALEENNEGVSNSYYKKQIELEEQKLDIYAEEKAALTELANITPKGTDEWYEIANALWEVDHAMQQSTIDAIKMRKAMIENYENAFENIGTAFSDKDKLFDDSKEYLQNVLDLLDLHC